MVRNLILSTAILLLMQLPASAGDVNGFDILGVRIGASVQDVTDIMKSRKLNKASRIPAPSFEQAIALAANKTVPANSYAGVQSITFSNDDARMEIRFAQTSEGPRVRQVIYTVFSGIPLDKMRADVIDKYGPPDKNVMGRDVWGDTALPFSRKSVWMEFDDDPPPVHSKNPVSILTLSDPAFWERAQDAITNRARESH